MDFLNFQIVLKKPIDFINQFELYQGIFQTGVDEKFIDSFLKEFLQQLNSHGNFKKLNLHQFSLFTSKLPTKFRNNLYEELSCLKQKNIRGEAI